MIRTLAELDTPVVVVDLEVMEDNISRMAAYCKKYELKLRPHVKTHKTVDIARLQMNAGACGIACQKLGEAEVMVTAGLTDILVCYNIVGQQKLVRLRDLASRANLSVPLDSSGVADGISWAACAAGTSIGVLIELDVGGGRTGVQSPKAALDLARHILKLRGLELLGLLIYPSTPRASPQLDETITLLQDDGIPISIVSGGGTTTAFSSHQSIIPNQACGVVNLHEQLIAVRGENVEGIWEVRARGKTQ